MGPIALKFGVHLETEQLIRFLCARSFIVLLVFFINNKHGRWKMTTKLAYFSMQHGITGFDTF